MSKKIMKDKALMMEEIKQLISEGKVVSITAKGYSMNPFVRHLEDTLTIGPWKDSDLKRGTAALARTTTGAYVFHRIIKREGKLLTLEGDGNIGIKEKATTDGVIGIMHSITRGGRIYTSESSCWKAYSWIWMLLRPVRRYPLAIWRRLNPQKPLR
jgi:hypothetical protein